MASTSAYVNGFGVFLPNQPVENDQIEQVLGSLGKASQRVKRRILINNGIRQRFYAIDPATGAATHSNAQLTAESIQVLCRQTDLTTDEIDCLACGTSSPDQFIPGHASMVQAELMCGPCDIASFAGVCCSGMAAFKYGYLHVLQGLSPCAVVSGSDLSSPSLRASFFQANGNLSSNGTKEDLVERFPIVAFRNEFLRWMLSDGAGSALISTRPREDGMSLRIDWMEVLSYAHESQPCMYAGMVKRDDGNRYYRDVNDPVEFFRDGLLRLSQDVDILQDRLPPLMSKAIARVRDKHDLRSDSIDWLAPHYSSSWFREPLRQGLEDLNLHIPYEKWCSNLETKGNTGAASIYIILDELLQSGKLRAEDRILCIVPESARMSFAFLHLTAL